MLRGVSTINLWAEDLSAATRWYTELLGVEPYFTKQTCSMRWRNVAAYQTRFMSNTA